MLADPQPLGWLTGYSETELQAAVRGVAPELADQPIVLHAAPDLDRPTWAAARATVGGHTFAKFAFSERTATRIWREGQVLQILGDAGMPVPELVASSSNPAFSATRIIRHGVPLDYETVAAASPETIGQVAVQLASFLSKLHATSSLRRLHRLPRLPQEELDISTRDLRERFTAMLAPRQRATVSGWCDWIDDQLARPTGRVFVHGDFHPYNQLWDLDEPRLLAIVDFETSGLAEREFDFRVLPVFGPSVDLLVSTVEHYQAMSGCTLSLPRIMALHVLNHLGDSLWRSEAGISAPGGTPTEHVGTSAQRLAALGIEP